VQFFKRIISAMEPNRYSKPPYNPGVGRLIRDKRAWSIPPSDNDARHGFLSWHENGYLPHRDEPGMVQFVTFRLADAFPLTLRREWEALLSIEDARQRQAQLESYLDRGFGECHLRQFEIGQLVENTLRFFDRERYEMRAWVVMPNHVHALFLTTTVPMWRILNGWKSYTSKQANKLLGRSGRFWQAGYWDTYMRDAEQELRARRYIESNPIKAKLVRDVRDWLWSSARFRDDYGRLECPGSDAGDPRVECE
jgi:REP-associated tyrosine transposase